MIILVIWSKDRACQLHALLHSIFKYADNTFDVRVVYTHSDHSYAEGYNRVISKFPSVSFCLETDFKKDTIYYSFLDRWQYKDGMLDISAEPDDLICYSTDDMIIFRDLPVKGKTLEELMNDEKLATFSLRLGLNTLLQDYHAGIYQPPLNRYFTKGEIITWRWVDYHPLHNYGYPCGLDMHIFRKSYMFNIMKNCDFRRSNTLETYMWENRYQLPPLISSFTQSVAVNVPVNNISNVTASGKDYSYSLSDLNSLYLSGKLISIEDIGKNKIIGCHQELEYKFINVE